MNLDVKKKQVFKQIFLKNIVHIFKQVKAS